MTALVAAPRGRVRVDLDGERWRTLPAAAVVGARLTVGIELDRLRARTLRRELRRAQALAIVTRELGRRERSVADLDARLARRGVAPGQRAETLEMLERAGYVDDPRLACERAAALAERDLGDAAIRFDLERLGVAAVEIEQALARLPSEPDRAIAIARRRGRSAGTARRLAARGFSVDAIEEAIGQVEPPDW